ncbi:Thioredoxin family protein [Trichomonas vaginalis G3]|uniref:Thioredoxin family protein n=1 Tax=Trichomonas vaginalis (strain ATCC PRA-98 / G3) TaxID=412133 RepID=A2GBZ3_TRIV3|nr:cell redox homeostasis [Trichomonas vaginalis G3]EAX82592.1 Thioredoxin family protein [Trichomonas vaginalis G3]EAX85325.1 Thioredoxin family protein [Trichomonas vaginalis G3]KAI5497419.1 cell redox homeostasis [Trichomonas vaginalis G3]|eukprot:XP_001295522.1 Thioredoxin family protein [Trichomonas vaginalis G3]
MSSSDSIIDFTGGLKELKELIQQKKSLIVVDVYASWCGGCKVLGQRLPIISEKNPDVTFIKVDCEKNEVVGCHFDPPSLPGIYFLRADSSKEGYKILDEMYGANIQKIEDLIAKYK